MVGHLADVDEAVLVHADVDKGAEGGDVGDDAVEGHARTQVFDFADVLVELKGLEGLAWVAARLLQLGEDIVDGLQAKMLFYKLSRLDYGDEFLVADKVFHFHAQFLGHFLHDVVALGVDGTLVQRIVAVMDAQETCTLLEGFVAEARHTIELLACLEAADFVAVVDDVVSQGGSDAADIRQQLLAGGVEFHAYGVHAALHGLVEALAEFLLVHIVLILSHADALRVYLYQLGQRVHQSASDAHRTSHGDVVVGELVTGDFGGGIH